MFRINLSFRELFENTKWILMFSWDCFNKERMQYRAQALTYSTLMAVVPFFAIIFAIAKGFGLSEFIEGRIHAAFPTQPETVNTLMDFVSAYLDHTKGGIFLGFGIILLLYSLLSLTDSIERTFNQIWQVKRDRPLSRKLTDYTAVVFLLPIIIFVSMGFTMFLSNTFAQLSDIVLIAPATKVLLVVIHYFIICLLFVILYIFMPHVRVKLTSALVAGIPVGICFELWQTVYLNSQQWLSGYNAIYGSFAAIPLFMIWCQISWYIILFGATMSCVYQSDNRLSLQSLHVGGRSGEDYLCLTTMRIICKRFHQGTKSPTVLEIAQELNVPVRIINDVMNKLIDNQLILSIEDVDKEKNTTFVPASDVHNYTVGYVLQKLDGTCDISDKEFSEPYIAYRNDIFQEGFAAKKLIDL